MLDAGPRSASCLMASMTDPRISNFVVSWPMYREGEDVYIQNAIIFLDEVGEAFDPAAPWECAGPRCGRDEDGSRASEWVTSMSSLREFFGWAVRPRRRPLPASPSGLAESRAVAGGTSRRAARQGVAGRAAERPGWPPARDRGSSSRDCSPPVKSARAGGRADLTPGAETRVDTTRRPARRAPGGGTVARLNGARHCRAPG